MVPERQLTPLVSTPPLRRAASWWARSAAALALALSVGVSTSVAAAAPPGAPAAFPGYLLAATGTTASNHDGTINRCTLGFVVIGSDGLARALTAAHCGKVGDQIFTRDSTPIGVVSARDPEVDIALVGVHTNLQVFSDVDGIGRVNGYMSIEELNRTQPILCKKGLTTGVTCGRMIQRAKSTHIIFDGGALPGDSGGPVWAVRPNGDLAAVGIVSAYYEDGTSDVYTIPVAPFMEKWALRLP